MHTVHIQDPNGQAAQHYGKDYFPRKFYYISEAKECAINAHLIGAKEIKIVGSNGKTYHCINGKISIVK